MTTKLFPALTAALLLTPALLCAGDWPEFRGNAQRTAVWHEPGLPAALPKEGPKVLWRQSIGHGYSGPAVANGRVFIQDRLKPGGTNTADTERLLCLDARDGSLTWAVAHPRELKLRGGYDNGPRCTPTVRDGRVFALGAMGDFVCADEKTGAVIWRKDFLKEFSAEIPEWGLATSPLIEGRLVIVQAGGKPGATVIAFDRETGREAWRALDDKAGYAPVIAIESAGRRQLIAWTGEAMCALDPVTGAVHWREPRKLAWDQAVSVPTWHAGRSLLLFPSDREGCVALRLASDRPAFTTAWDRTALACLHASPVLVGDHVYALHHYGLEKATCGQVRCINVADGEMKWAEGSVTKLKGFAQATLTLNAATGVWYVTNDRGELITAKMTPEGFQELSRAQLTGTTWSHPAYAQRRIFARSETTLLCAALE
jgi:outer membrane protein assembly factor BamB